MIAKSEDGDVLFFHYSGHGMRAPAQIDDDDETGYDECIVPCDMNFITDDDFRELISKLPSGVALTIVSDSCHSGGLIEAAKEQIGDSHNPQGKPEADPLQFGEANSGDEENEERSAGTKQVVYVGEDGMEVRSKALPLDTYMEMLRDRTGRQDIEVGSIRRTLYDIFREDSSSKVKKFLRERSAVDEEESVLNSAADDGDACVQAAMETGLRYATEAAYAGPGKTVTSMGVLVSGCQSHQTSADAANPNGDPADAFGALSNAIQTIFASTEAGGQPISNRYLVTEVRRLLASQGYTQQPGLYCTDENAEAPFIC
ncbi:hypothetical protein KP509_04G013100 [Ceratopteris richardii]|nr:hypothetical protein KP509_04G013100 [Ceratopteris richardii]